MGVSFTDPRYDAYWDAVDTWNQHALVKAWDDPAPVLDAIRRILDALGGLAVQGAWCPSTVHYRDYAGLALAYECLAEDYRAKHRQYLALASR